MWDTLGILGCRFGNEEEEEEEDEDEEEEENDDDDDDGGRGSKWGAPRTEWVCESTWSF